ncbi:1_t:CDS:2 [Gigaspora margarita]|uniref:1_t:CDS:1 n=1 Tax=Gigaspora margarita TaxID=4874 RepID=A0ABM8W6I7_GIGMA|nr:1_t:CDS:2 [Gigaspora margarita]
MTTTNSTISNVRWSKTTKNLNSMINSNNRFSRFSLESNVLEGSIIGTFINPACRQYESKRKAGREYPSNDGLRVYQTYDTSQPSPSSRSDPNILRGENNYSSFHYYLLQFYKIRLFFNINWRFGAERMSRLPNAGGKSELSEILSCEIMERILGVELNKTELLEHSPIIEDTQNMTHIDY